MIEVQRDDGSIYYEKSLLIYFIEEQLKMVPGIISLDKRGLIKILRKLFILNSGNVKVFQINKNEIYIELELILSKDIKYTQIENEIRKVLKYSLYRKYGLDITNIEIIIQDLI